MHGADDMTIENIDITIGAVSVEIWHEDGPPARWEWDAIVDRPRWTASGNAGSRDAAIAVVRVILCAWADADEAAAAADPIGFAEVAADTRRVAAELAAVGDIR